MFKIIFRTSFRRFVRKLKDLEMFPKRKNMNGRSSAVVGTRNDVILRKRNILKTLIFTSTPPLSPFLRKMSKKNNNNSHIIR